MEKKKKENKEKTSDNGKSQIEEKEKALNNGKIETEKKDNSNNGKSEAEKKEKTLNNGKSEKEKNEKTEKEKDEKVEKEKDEKVEKEKDEKEKDEKEKDEKKKDEKTEKEKDEKVEKEKDEKTEKEKDEKEKEQKEEKDKRFENILRKITLWTIFFITYLFEPLNRLTIYLTVKSFELFEIFPSLLTFIFLLFLFYIFLSQYDKSIYSYIFGITISFLITYILYYLNVLVVPDFLIKCSSVIFQKIYFIPRFLISDWIAGEISGKICKFYKETKEKNKKKKIFTYEDEEYIKELLNKNKTIFILYSEASDPNYNFYKKELSKISYEKDGKLTFIIIRFNKEFEKYLYSLCFDKYSTKSLFGALKGEKTKLMETFPEKNNFYNEINVFVSDYECKEMKEVINKNKANDKEIKTEKKDNNKENDEEKKKKD